jgi:hypothetical protein
MQGEAMYFIEFIVAVLFAAGVVLFGVFALSKVLAAVVAVCLVVFFVRIEGSKGLIFVGAGFAACALVVTAVSKVLF